MAKAAGKRYRPKPYRITFAEGHELEDLEVQARRLSVGELLELMSTAEMAQDLADGTVTAPTDEHKKAMDQMITDLAGVITWWNVDKPPGEDEIRAARAEAEAAGDQDRAAICDRALAGDADAIAEFDGIPVAPDEAGLRAQDFVMVMAIYTAYVERVMSVMPPLPSGSNDGPSPAELASIPTETQPPSPGS